MSTVMNRNSGTIGCRASIFDSSELDPGDRRAEGADDAAAAAATACSSSVSSSIGKNSDAASGGGEEDEEEENEVQSSYRGPLDMMDSLEEVLPCRKGISNFYQGKSKSYTSLANASSSNIKEIAKPENAYTRRRRNLLAFHYSTLKSNAISKRPLSSSKSSLALAMAMGRSESYSSSSEDSSSSSVSLSKSPPPSFPPLHPNKSSKDHVLSPRWSSSPWKSYSVADLQHCTNPLARVRFKDPIDEKADPEEELT